MSFSNYFFLCYLETISQYNFAYLNCNGINTPITEQLKYMQVTNEKSQKTENQIMQIWKSLNKNQRQIAQILAKN